MNIQPLESRQKTCAWDEAQGEKAVTSFQKTEKALTVVL